MENKSYEKLLVQIRKLSIEKMLTNEVGSKRPALEKMLKELRLAPREDFYVRL